MLTIHHLQVSQSERLVWLCEELGIPYKLELHIRAPLFSPPSLQALYPLGFAPIIQDDVTPSGPPLTLAESGACAEYIIHKYGGGRLVLGPTHPDFAKYVYWFHFANGSLQSVMSRVMTLYHAGVDPDSDAYKRVIARLEKHLKHIEAHLGQDNEWLAGVEFTAADIMNVFSLTTGRTFYPLDLTPYPNILTYLERVAAREKYKTAREKADPTLPLMIGGPPPEQFIDQLKKKV